MCLIAVERGPSGSERRSINPGSAAASAPMMPPAIVYSATVVHAALAAPPTWNRSQTNEKIHRPIGIGTSIGWMGWRAMLAGVCMASDGFEVLDEVGFFLLAQPQAEMAVVMVHHVHERREASVMVEAALVRLLHVPERA